MYIYMELLGTAELVKNHTDLAVSIDSGEEVQETKTLCNKETGEKKVLQKWTRGTWFCVSGSGHIYSWKPLYQLVVNN